MAQKKIKLKKETELRKVRLKEINNNIKNAKNSKITSDL